MRHCEEQHFVCARTSTQSFRALSGAGQAGEGLLSRTAHRLVEVYPLSEVRRGRA